MNLVEQIKQQLTSEAIEQLSSVLGANKGVTGAAVDAAVPALLAALSGLTSSSSGTQKFLSALGRLGSGSVENMGQKMSSQPGAVLEQGTELLSSLLGGSTISGIVNAVSRFASIAPETVHKLLSYLTPLLLGTIASRFTGKAINAQGLADMLAAEKTNISRALPSGFSLGELPGLAAAGSTAARSAARGVEAAGSSLARKLLPWLGLAALALLVWWFIPKASPPAPEAIVPSVTRAQSPDNGHALVPEAAKSLVSDVTRFSTELKETFSTLTEALGGVKDAASAEAALPKLQELEGKLDAAKATMKGLGDSGKTTIKTLVTSAEDKLRVLADKVLAIPGVGDKLKTVVDSIMTKLTDLSV